MKDKLTETIERILSVFETGSPSRDYKSVFLYRDGNDGRKQVTLGVGFTSDGGNLQKVIMAYVLNKGQDAEYLGSKVCLATPEMVTDAEFLRRLSKAGEEQAMKDAQDFVFKTVYLDPAYAWAKTNGFILPLSIAVIADSFLHSGSMRPALMNSFPERKPVDGGGEKKWIEQYLLARKQWLFSKGGLLRNTVYRPDFFLEQIKNNNWNLEPPLSSRGTKIT